MSENKWGIDSILANYDVTEDGRVFSKTSNWRGYGYRELKQILNSHGYLTVRITIGGKRKKLVVHKLVALAFLGPKPHLSAQIRHLDGKRSNNHRSNLAWGSAAENAADRAAHGTTCRGERLSRIILESRDQLRRSCAIKHCDGKTMGKLGLCGKHLKLRLNRRRFKPDWDFSTAEMANV